MVKTLLLQNNTTEHIKSKYYTNTYWIHINTSTEHDKQLMFMFVNKTQRR